MLDLDRVREIHEAFSKIKFPSGEDAVRISHCEAVKVKKIKIHYFTNKAVIERNTNSIDEFLKLKLKEIMSQAGVDNCDVDLIYIDALNTEWPKPWAESIYRRIPTVIINKETGQGALFHDPQLRNPIKNIANEFPDGFSESYFKDNLTQGISWYGLVFNRHLEKKELEDSFDFSPLTNKNNQCYVVVFKDYEWFSGLFNVGKELALSSVPDFYDVNVSKELKERRVDGMHLFDKVAVQGDVEKIKEACQLQREEAEPEYLRYESSKSVRHLCEYWDQSNNSEVKAGSFRAYQWDEEKSIFIALDPEEPNWKPEHFEPYLDSTAAFKIGGKLVLFIFAEGRDKWGVSQYRDIVIKTTGGVMLYEIGTTKESYDEAMYSWEILGSIGE